MAKKPPEDPVMDAVREALKASRMTQQELGDKMGYPAESARKSVSQFLRSHDPRVGMVRRFAKAIGISIERLFRKRQPKKNRVLESRKILKHNDMR